MIDGEKLMSEVNMMNDDSFIQVESDHHDYWRETELNDSLSQDDSESFNSVSTSHSQVSESKKTKIKSRFSELHKHDKGFFKLKMGRNEPSITGFSTSYFPGSTIRNAVTGIYESDYMGKPLYKVGSDDEDIFFVVSVSLNGISEPRKLYYDSPEQCERHFKTTISAATKQKWVDKHNMAILRDQNRREIQEQPQYTSVH